MSTLLRPSALAALLAAVTLISAGAVGASATRTVTVCPTGPPACDYTTIHDALTAASDGDRILIASGTYAGGLTIDKSVRLIGAGADRVAISGGDPAGVRVISGRTVAISGLTIEDASPGLVNDGTLSVREISITENTVTDEFLVGGMLNRGTLLLESSAVVHNLGRREGPGDTAGIVNEGTARLTDCTFSLNGGGGGAAAILNDGRLVLRRCTLNHNFGRIAWAEGTIVNRGEAEVAETTFSDNNGRLGSGGISNQGGLRLTDSVFIDNAEGAIGNSAQGRATIVDCVFSGNGSRGGAGAIGNGGTMTLRRTTISGSSSSFGDHGAIWNFGSLTIHESTLSDNDGGIVNLGEGSLTVRDSTVSGNGGGLHSTGAGLFNVGDALLVFSTVSDNTAFDAGGGIFNRGDLTLRHSTVTGNTAMGHNGLFGGGIYNDGGTVTLRHSPVFGNTPDDCVGC